MQKFTRAITREVELGGERLAWTFDEKGVSVRPVGSRKPPRELSWAALLAVITGGGEEPGTETVVTALHALKGATATKSQPPAPEQQTEAPRVTPPPPPSGGPLERLQHWLEQHRPRYARGLLPGASEGELDALQAGLGTTLPGELRGLLRWHNGQSEEFVGSFEDGWNLMSARQIGDARRELVGEGAGERAGWVPFLADDKGDYLFFDTSRPGVPVRAFWLGKAEQPEVAPSLAAWLEDFAGRVEGGEYAEDAERGCFVRRQR